MDKKKVFWAVLFLIIAGISIWAVTSQNKNFSFDLFVNYITNSNPVYMTLAVLSAFGFILFEGLALLVIIKGFGYKRRFLNGMLYSSADIYFSAITPSATGGQPASAYFMVKDGIPSATVTVSLLVCLIMYTTSLMTVAVVAVVFGYPIFVRFSFWGKVFIVIGFFIQVILTIFFSMLLKNRGLTEKICDFFLKLFKKLHLLKNYEAKKEKLVKTMDEFQVCAEMISGKKTMLIKAYLFNLFQRLCNVSVSALVFLAGGGGIKEAVNVWIAQNYVAIGANSVPIPGSMGVTDYLMLNAFGQFMEPEMASNLELLSRSLSFYICIFVCSITTLLGYIIIRKRSKSC